MLPDARLCTLTMTEEAIMKKTISFAMMHFSVAFSVAYMLTGSAVVGGMLALIEPAVNTVVFYFHEKAWKRIDEGVPLLTGLVH